MVSSAVHAAVASVERQTERCLNPPALAELFLASERPICNENWSIVHIRMDPQDGRGLLGPGRANPSRRVVVQPHRHDRPRTMGRALLGSAPGGRRVDVGHVAKVTTVRLKN